MKKLKVFALVLSVVMLVMCCSCSGQSTSDQSTEGTSTGSSDTDVKIGFQLEKPEVGEEIAVIKTSMGTVKLRLFEEKAPKTVENFKGLARKGYYDGMIFHRVIEDFMIQGGAPDGDGTKGESLWGTAFEDEFNADLLNITGALSMANSGKDTNGSQFFINYNSPKNFNGWDYYKQYWSSYKSMYDQYYSSDPDTFEQYYGSTFNTDLLTDDIKKLYEENGGNPTLDGYYSPVDKGHTVFGQVIEGLDVVKKISLVKTDSDDKPKKDVVMKSVTIETYEG